VQGAKLGLLIREVVASDEWLIPRARHASTRLGNAVGTGYWLHTATLQGGDLDSIRKLLRES